MKSKGVCPVCEEKVTFSSVNDHLRDFFFCSFCGSIPRERALAYVLETRFPDWRDFTIHESSPVKRSINDRLKLQCADYIPTQYCHTVPPGEIFQGYRCENLESLTFEDESIDIHVTQDVMEHLMNPAEAFREIGRTLRPGGAHVFTVPLVNKHRETVCRARSDAGKIEHLLPPVYHENPVEDPGSLVTFDYGFDITRRIFDACGLFSDLIYIDDISKGIRAEYIEVLITWK